MSAAINLVGKVFERLTVIERLPMNGKTYYRCLCICGKERVIDGTSLTGKNTVSCGCYRNDRIIETCTTHGMTGTKEYRTWNHMHDRCYNPNNKKYHIYGGRGITLCPEWRKENNGFFKFFEDMGYAPCKESTIHRKDNDKAYSPDSCKWTDYIEQNNNRSNSVRVIIDGQFCTKNKASEILGVSLGTIEHYQAKGFTLDSIALYFKSGQKYSRNKTLLEKRGE